MVVLVSGSRFFSFITLGFLPTVNGQPHRGISPPRPALWSRRQLGKKRPRLSLCVSFLTLQSLLQHLHLRCGSCWCFCLHPFCLLILVHPSIHPSVCPSVLPFVRHVCCLNSSFCRFSTKLLAKTSSNNQVNVGVGA